MSAVPMAKPRGICLTGVGTGTAVEPTDRPGTPTVREYPVGYRGCTPRMATNSATVELTKDNFNETIDRDGIVVVDWWASWCGPCRMFAPIFEEAAGEHPDIVFGKVDTEAEQELAGAARISSIPTLMIFRDRKLLFSQPGALPKHVLDDLIRQVRDLDMSKL
jgi:thioredoxin 1